MNTKLLLFGLLLFGFGCSSSNRESNSSQEAQNFFQTDEASNSITDKNDPREIHFTELWTWEYLDENGDWDEIWIYREPNLDYWLFDKSSSYGMTSEMCEWIVGTPEGKYW